MCVRESVCARECMSVHARECEECACERVCVRARECVCPNIKLKLEL